MIYQPKNEELLEMGFIPRIWEGVTYRYDFESLSFHVCKVDGTPFNEVMDADDLGVSVLVGEPFWSLWSWYRNWYPQSKEEVILLISRYKKPL